MNILAVHNHPDFVKKLMEAITTSSYHHDLSAPPNVLETHTLEHTLAALVNQDNIALILISMDLAKHESSAWMTAVRSHRPTTPILFVTDSPDQEVVGKIIAKESVSCPFDSPSGRIVLNAILTGISLNLRTDVSPDAPSSNAATSKPVNTQLDSIDTLADHTSGESLNNSSNASNQDELKFRLTPRQWQVLGLLRDGHSNKQIARLLTLAEGTVKIHCLAIYRILGVSNRTQAAMHINQLSRSSSTFVPHSENGPPR